MTPPHFPRTAALFISAAALAGLSLSAADACPPDAGGNGPAITIQPVSTLACPHEGGEAFFHIAAEGFGQDFTYQWEVQDILNLPDFIPITDGPYFEGIGPFIFIAEGTNSPNLHLTNLGNAAIFRCTVSNQCGHDSSSEVSMTFTCRADFNCSLTISVQDVYDFLTAWSAQVGQMYGTADFNYDFDVSVQDIYDFLTEWSAGCEQ